MEWTTPVLTETEYTPELRRLYCEAVSSGSVAEIPEDWTTPLLVKTSKEMQPWSMLNATPTAIQATIGTAAFQQRQQGGHVALTPWWTTTAQAGQLDATCTTRDGSLTARWQQLPGNPAGHLLIIFLPRDGPGWYDLT
jgi:hypothetical protein